MDKVGPVSLAKERSLPGHAPVYIEVELVEVFTDGKSGGDLGR